MDKDGLLCSAAIPVPEDSIAWQDIVFLVFEVESHVPKKCVVGHGLAQSCKQQVSTHRTHLFFYSTSRHQQIVDIVLDRRLCVVTGLSKSSCMNEHASKTGANLPKVKPISRSAVCHVSCITFFHTNNARNNLSVEQKAFVGRLALRSWIAYSVLILFFPANHAKPN